MVMSMAATLAAARGSAFLDSSSVWSPVSRRTTGSPPSRASRGSDGVPSVVLSFPPLLEDVIEKADGVTTTTWRYGTLWEMAGRDGGGPAAAGVLTIAIAAHAAVLALMLLTMPGTAEPTAAGSTRRRRAPRWRVLSRRASRAGPAPW